MTYQCPKCHKYGMEWDGRAKVLLCYYNSCNFVLRIANQRNVPNPKRILEAIEEAHLQNGSELPNKLVTT